MTGSRTSAYPISEIFLDRWSPRAMSDEAILESELLTMLEAARWAPSSYNAQPWRFLYARRDTEYWSRFHDLLVPFNQAWAHRAAALVVVTSNSQMRLSGADGDAPSYTHSFDAGIASGYLALQASLMGWYAHGMIGLDLERAARDLLVPADWRVEAAFAIGRMGNPTELPEAFREREKPSDRRPLNEIAFEGGFPAV